MDVMRHSKPIQRKLYIPILCLEIFGSVMLMDAQFYTPPANQRTLQSATNLFGPWTNVIGVTSPLTSAPAAPQQFYRVLLQ
jgi:hypothetical protein